MTLTDRTNLMLLQINERLAITMIGRQERAALATVKTAVEGLLITAHWSTPSHELLTSLCDQWEASRR